MEGPWRYLAWVHGLEGKEQHDGLQLMRPSVDPVAVEDVRGRLHVASLVGGRAIVGEEQQQVAQLAVHVAEDLGGRLHVHE